MHCLAIEIKAIVINKNRGKREYSKNSKKRRLTTALMMVMLKPAWVAKVEKARPILSPVLI